MVKHTLSMPVDRTPHIMYVGIFDFNKLVMDIANWFQDQGFEFHENNFKFKVPSPDGSEPEFNFYGWRRVTEYVKYWITIKAHIWELKEVEVVIDGKKKKMAKGKVKIRLSIKVDLDYNEKFDTAVTEKLQTFLEKHIWRKQIDGGWTDECYFRMLKLHRVIKESLNMSTATNASGIRY